ncbi:MAG: site-specific DNA-methyltransferase [Anaerolineales bacterium]|nr:site-specific DNA-methyltransferase [Anaerolineales bacterium]
MNRLYYGDNLTVLREHLTDESVDLIYLDPPFNSQRDYNLLFKTPKGHESDAQITAFEDTWHWGPQAEQEFAQLLHQPNTDVAEMIQSLRRFLRESDVMAYLTMMANRLLELRRVLKLSGSLYLHCDPTAGHYLKLVLDTIFGPENFRNEIIWQRTNVHSDSKTWSRVSDTIFFYTKSGKFTWNPIYASHSDEHLKSKYRQSDPSGRLYTLSDMTSPNPRPNMMYEWKGYPSPPNGWRYSKETMAKLDADGRIWYPGDTTKRPRLKRYLDEMSGTLLGNVWTDINPINSQAAERLGYPTQKPLALLERIIQASSQAGDMVLDPFCGCGTAVHAAQKLGRQWIGIDITHLAIGLIEKRMKDAFPSLAFGIYGTPRDLEGARDLALRDKYQFQWWACSLVNAQPYQGKKKGADSGIDGLIFFQDELKGAAKKIVVSVKGGETVTRTMMADLKNTVEREKAQIGLFVTLTPPTKPMVVEASSAGYYESPHSGAFPKIQILTIEGLLSGQESPKYPDLSRGGLSFKKAKAEGETGEQGKLF